MSHLKFEAALSRLDDLVGRLEKGNLSLEESLKVFEEGVRLSMHCSKLLTDAEKRVEILIADKEGGKQAQPLNLSETRDRLNEDSQDETDDEDGR